MHYNTTSKAQAPSSTRSLEYILVRNESVFTVIASPHFRLEAPSPLTEKRTTKRWLRSSVLAPQNLIWVVPSIPGLQAQVRGVEDEIVDGSLVHDPHLAVAQCPGTEPPLVGEHESTLSEDVSRFEREEGGLGVVGGGG